MINRILGGVLHALAKSARSQRLLSTVPGKERVRDYPVTRSLPRTVLNLSFQHPRTYAKISGATIVASDSMMYFGVSAPSLPQVIFSLGTAPE